MRNRCCAALVALSTLLTISSVDASGAYGAPAAVQQSLGCSSTAPIPPSAAEIAVFTENGKYTWVPPECDTQIAAAHPVPADPAVVGQSQAEPSYTFEPSGNWSGYVGSPKSGNNWEANEATFKVAKALDTTCTLGSSTAYSSSWNSFGTGQNDNDLLVQIGTETDETGEPACTVSSNSYAWYEFADLDPDCSEAQQPLKFSVSPGDTIETDVEKDTSDSATLVFRDTTQMEVTAFGLYWPSQCSTDNLAAAITERTLLPSGNLPLVDDFGSQQFQDDIQRNNGTFLGLGQAQNSYLYEMVSCDGGNATYAYPDDSFTGSMSDTFSNHWYQYGEVQPFNGCNA